MKMNVGVFLNSFFEHIFIDKIFPIMPKTHNKTVNSEVKKISFSKINIFVFCFNYLISFYEIVKINKILIFVIIYIDSHKQKILDGVFLSIIFNLRLLVKRFHIT